jgi:hypothetical protein
MQRDYYPERTYPLPPGAQPKNEFAVAVVIFHPFTATARCQGAITWQSAFKGTDIHFSEIPAYHRGWIGVEFIRTFPVQNQNTGGSRREG